MEDEQETEEENEDRTEEEDDDGTDSGEHQEKAEARIQEMERTADQMEQRHGEFGKQAKEASELVEGQKSDGSVPGLQERESTVLLTHASPDEAEREAQKDDEEQSSGGASDEGGGGEGAGYDEREDDGES